jgi:hypothetical protein
MGSNGLDHCAVGKWVFFSGQNEFLPRKGDQKMLFCDLDKRL